MRVTIEHWEPLTPEQCAEIDRASQLPITYDEDAPDLTPETFAAFQEAARRRDAAKNSKAM